MSLFICPQIHDYTFIPISSIIYRAPITHKASCAKCCLQISQWGAQSLSLQLAKEKAHTQMTTTTGQLKVCLLNRHCISHSSHLMKSESPQSCPILCGPMDYTVHGILQARILEWVAFPFSRGSSWSRNQTGVSCIVGGFLTSWGVREAFALLINPILLFFFLFPFHSFLTLPKYYIIDLRTPCAVYVGYFHRLECKLHERYRNERGLDPKSGT